jgi:TonB family protein
LSKIKMKRISLLFLVVSLAAGAPVLSVAETETTETEIDKSVELEFWQNVKDSDNEDMLRAYLEHYPNGKFKSLAETKIKQLAETEEEVVTSSTSISEDQQVTAPSVPLSVLTRGLDAYYKGDYQSAYHILAPLAEVGEPQAQVRVARMLLEARGANRDKLGAIAMFNDALAPIQAAAGEGIPWAQSDLADYFVDGLLFAQDLSKAAFWYRKAAEQGYAPAQTNLGWLSFNGYDEVAPNRAVAVHWFREAAAQGNPAAVRNLQALGEPLLDRPGVTTEDPGDEEETVPSGVTTEDPGDEEETVPSDTQNHRDEADALVAFGSVAWAIKEQVSKNWSEPGDFSGLSVAFLVKVDREGNVLSVKMTRSSGDARLDESAENAIFKASPLPFPDEERFYEYLKEFNFIFKPES